MIKKLALVKDTGNPEVDKYVGQVRHILDTVFSVLLALGLLTRFGIEVSEDSFFQFLNLAEGAVDAVYVAIGAVGKVIVHVSSWFSKEV